MKKFSLFLVIFLILAAVVTGCSTTATTPATTTAAVTTTSPATSTKPVTTTAVTTSAPTTTSAATTSAATTTTKPVVTTTPPATGKQTYGGTLRIISGTTPGSPLGWPPETSGINANQQQVAMDMLVWEDIKGNIVPHLAESYDLNSDPANPSITFHLRKGVKFSDGTDLNAQAVKWDFDQVKANPVSAGVTRVWKSIDLIDDYTVRVNYTQWQNQLIRSYVTATTMIFSPTAYQKNGIDWMRWHMVGTGPFQQSNYQPDVILSFIKNPYYWEQGKPYLDGVQFIYVVDELTQNALFKTGGGDVLQTTPKSATELAGQGYQIITRERNTNMLLPDSANADSPWSKLKVRQAAEYALDKEQIAKTFGYGFWKPAYQIPPTTSPAYIPSLEQRKYNPAKAKQLLAEAGFPNGFKTTLYTSANNKDINTAYQAYFQAVGIQANLEMIDGAKAQQLMAGGTWNNALLGSGVVLYANFNNILSQWFNVPPTFFKSTKRPDGYEALLNASLNSPKPDPVLMQKAVQSLYDDATVIPIVYDTAHTAVTDKVHDTGMGQQGSFSLWTPDAAWLSK